MKNYLFITIDIFNSDENRLEKNYVWEYFKYYRRIQNKFW